MTRFHFICWILNKFNWGTIFLNHRKYVVKHHCAFKTPSVSIFHNSITLGWTCVLAALSFLLKTTQSNFYHAFLYVLESVLQLSSVPSLFHSFLSLNNTWLSGSSSLFSHCPTGGHLACLRIWAVMNESVSHICTGLFFFFMWGQTL